MRATAEASGMTLGGPGGPGARGRGQISFLAEQVGALFLPWSDANARAIGAGEESFEVTLAGRRWQQKPQKYHARSLSALRERYAAVADRSALDPILDSTGCLPWLTR